MATVYILYSVSINQYYIGSCSDFDKRLDEHLNHAHDGFTNRASDWELFFKLDDLGYKQARSIENHIKRMKSTTYIKNLKNYPEISYKLIQRYT